MIETIGKEDTLMDDELHQQKSATSNSKGNLTPKSLTNLKALEGN